jgi:hypothetical protein
MKRSDSPAGPLPRHDSDVALKSAVSWLGDRYLLAAPLPRRNDEPKSYFAEQRRWHPAGSAGSAGVAPKALNPEHRFR